MKRPQGKMQTSTGLGITGLLNHLVIVFHDVQVDQIWTAIKGAGVDDIIITVAPFALWFWAIMHNEDQDFDKIAEGIIASEPVEFKADPTIAKEFEGWIEDKVKTTLNKKIKQARKKQ